jgi:hypothetical protein
MGEESDELDLRQRPDEARLLEEYKSERGKMPEAFQKLHGRAMLLLRRSGVTSGLAPPERAMKTVIQRVPSAAFRELPPSRYLVFPIRKTERSLIERFYSVGQTRNNDVVVRDVSVSKFHAYFQENDAGQLVLQDARSTNGTFVNAIRVPRQGEGDPIVVKSGDRIRFGNVELSLMAAKEFLELLDQVYAE